MGRQSKERRSDAPLAHNRWVAASGPNPVRLQTPCSYHVTLASLETVSVYPPWQGINALQNTSISFSLLEP